MQKNCTVAFDLNQDMSPSWIAKIALEIAHAAIGREEREMK
jgi:hypothetical protein